MLSRRSFLRLLTFAPAAVRVATVAAAPRGALLLTTAIAGYRFHDGPSIERRLLAGGRLVLRREAGNVHDPNAIAVFHPAGALLGYLPRRENGIPARLMDQGIPLSAEIAAIAPPPAHPWERLTITVRFVPRRLEASGTRWQKPDNSL